MLNYFDRQILSLVSPVLRVDFSLSASQYALLLDSFLLGYTSLQFLAGWLVDRVGARRGLLIAMLWWSAAGTLAAAARKPNQLALCLFLMGIGEAANWPCAVKAIQEWFPPNKRALAVGLFNSGSSVGAIIAPIVVSRLTLHYSWRTAFLSCGILGLLWVAPWRFFYSQPPLAAPSGRGTHVLLVFLLDVRAWGIILARFFADSIWFFYVFWLPDFLTHVQLLSLREIGATAWIPFVAAAAGNFAGGAASGYLISMGRNVVRSRLVVMAAAAFVMSGGVAIRYCHQTSLAIIVISVVVFAYSAWATNVLTLPSDIFPSAAVATVTGTAGTLAGLGGVLTTYLAGRVIDRYSYGPVFIGLSFLPILALSCSLLSARTPRAAAQ
jgi:ACS family hexuronate transporter-like MFS transporter